MAAILTNKQISVNKISIGPNLWYDIKSVDLW